MKYAFVFKEPDGTWELFVGKDYPDHQSFGAATGCGYYPSKDEAVTAALGWGVEPHRIEVFGE